MATTKITHKSQIVVNAIFKMATNAIYDSKVKTMSNHEIEIRMYFSAQNIPTS